jgi:hypothetical protein
MSHNKQGLILGCKGGFVHFVVCASLASLHLLCLIHCVPSLDETLPAVAAAREYPPLGKNTIVSSNQAIPIMRSLPRTMSQRTRG